MTVSARLCPPKLWFTSMVVATKPSQTRKPEISPFATVTGPAWPMTPASVQAMTSSATKEMINGAGDGLPEGPLRSATVLPSAAIQGLARAMYQTEPRSQLATAAAMMAR
jgi:hypothetical protein